MDRAAQVGEVSARRAAAPQVSVPRAVGLVAHRVASAEDPTLTEMAGIAIVGHQVMTETKARILVLRQTTYSRKVIAEASAVEGTSGNGLKVEINAAAGANAAVGMIVGEINEVVETGAAVVLVADEVAVAKAGFSWIHWSASTVIDSRYAANC